MKHFFEGGELHSVQSDEHGFLTLRLPHRKVAGRRDHQRRWMIVRIGPRGGQKPIARGPWCDSIQEAKAQGRARLQNMFPTIVERVDVHGTTVVRSFV